MAPAGPGAVTPAPVEAPPNPPELCAPLAPVTPVAPVAPVAPELAPPVVEPPGGVLPEPEFAARSARRSS